MNDELINAFVARIKAGQMTIDQVPIPYRDAVQAKLDK
ncbi:MAG: CD1375 family protein [Caldicoprobacterales bacterium]